MQDAPERIYRQPGFKAEFVTAIPFERAAIPATAYITDAECQRRVDAAVLAEREAAKSLVWTLGHEIKAAMLVDEDNEQTVLDMVKATAAAIRARGQK